MLICILLPARSPSEVISKSLLHRSRFLTSLPSRSSFLSLTVRVLPFPLAMFPFPFILHTFRPRSSQNLFSAAHASSLPPPSFYLLSSTVHVSPFPLAMFPFPFSRVRSPSEVIAKSLLRRSRFLTSLPRHSSFLSPSAPLFFDICGQNAENRRLSYTRRHMRLRRFPRSKGTKCPFFGAQPEICRAGAHIAPSFP